MDFDTFASIVEETKAAQPVLFALKHDRIPSMEDICEIQKQYHLRLPEKYLRFLLNFGGGYFGYANIYSLDRDSYFYLPDHNTAACGDFLCFADNECGDYYAFRIRQGICEDAVYFYDHDDGELHDTEFSDVLEYLIKTGLSH